MVTFLVSPTFCYANKFTAFFNITRLIALRYNFVYIVLPSKMVKPITEGHDVKVTWGCYKLVALKSYSANALSHWVRIGVRIMVEARKCISTESYWS